MKRNKLCCTLIKGLIIVICILLADNHCFAGTVLWDTSRGVLVSNAQDHFPSIYYSGLITNLGTIGITVDITSHGLLVDNPDDYDVVVLSIDNAWDNAYSLAEAQLLSQFVSNGGGLLIMGDNLDCPNSNLQTVASEFGLSFGLSDLSDYNTYITTFGAHPIFDGINGIYMRHGGEMASAGGLAELAYEDGTMRAVVAAGGFGDGRIVALGDVDILSNYRYGEADNEQFATNIFNYLVPEPASLCLMAAGGLVLMRKRK